MAGAGKWDALVGKVRPGTYANFESTVHNTVGNSERGVVILPISGAKYGPENTYIEIYNSKPDANFSKLGYSVYDATPDYMLFIREALKKARLVKCYLIGSGGAKASAALDVASSNTATATAKYKGTRGNDIKVSITANVIDNTKFDVTTYIGTKTWSVIEGLSTCNDLKNNQSDDELVDWTFTSTSAALAAVAATSLSGGTDVTTENADITSWLDTLELNYANSVAFPFTDATLKTALKTKIKYLREDLGKGIVGVAPEFEADYEGIISVKNGYILDGKTNVTPQKAVAWVAGASAGATNKDSLVGVVVENATKTYYSVTSGGTTTVREMTHEEIVAAINAGHFVFSRDENDKVVVEYDINSLTTYNSVNQKDKGYRKNLVIRVFDTFYEMLKNNFKPNTYRNNPTGRKLIEGVGYAILKQYEDAEVIQNVDYDNDFAVDEEKSWGDEVYVNVGIQPVDMAEKLFFTVRTR